MLRSNQRTQISKTNSHALRHEPPTYGLTLDETGSLALSDLVVALRKTSSDYADLEEEDIVELTFTAEKVRHEINGGRIRALYGHSTAQTFECVAQPAPTQLFHGTSPESLEPIYANGLKPMARQYVHLSADTSTAQIVGRRKSSTPVILEIDARAAAAAGIAFFHAGGRVWLAPEVPPSFIRSI